MAVWLIGFAFALHFIYRDGVGGMGGTDAEILKDVSTWTIYIVFYLQYLIHRLWKIAFTDAPLHS